MIVKAVSILVLAYSVAGEPATRERTWTDPVPNTKTYSTISACRADLTEPKLGAAVWNRVLDHADEALPAGATVRRLAVHVRCATQSEE